jgi:hypothetical protein
LPLAVAVAVAATVTPAQLLDNQVMMAVQVVARQV